MSQTGGLACSDIRQLRDWLDGLTIAGEVKDIRLCGIAAKRAGETIAPRWRHALSLLNGIRRWVFLTAFGWIVPNLVALKGGDAVNVCFNTIAMVSPVQPFRKQQFPFL